MMPCAPWITNDYAHKTKNANMANLVVLS